MKVMAGGTTGVGAKDRMGRHEWRRPRRAQKAGQDFGPDGCLWQLSA